MSFRYLFLVNIFHIYLQISFLSETFLILNIKYMYYSSHENYNKILENIKSEFTYLYSYVCIDLV